MKTLITFIMILTSGAIFGQTKDIISVLDFTVNNITKQEMNIFTDFIASHIVNTGKYRVIDRMQRDNILKEIEFSLKDCTDESCQIEIGKMLAANLIILGSLGKVSDVFILNIKLIEVKTGETRASKSSTYDTMNALVKDTENLTLGLLGMKKGETVVAIENEKPVRKETAETEGFKQWHLDIAIGTVMSEFDGGFETDLGFRWLFFERLSLGGGICLGLQEGIRFGVNIGIGYRFSDALTLVLGFKGMPEYINNFGGPTLTIYIYNFILKGGIDILSSQINPSFNLDIGYSF